MIGPYCRVLLSWRDASVVGQMLHGDDNGGTLRRLAVIARLFSRHSAVQLNLCRMMTAVVVTHHGSKLICFPRRRCFKLRTTN